MFCDEETGHTYFLKCAINKGREICQTAGQSTDDLWTAYENIQ